MAALILLRTGVCIIPPFGLISCFDFTPFNKPLINSGCGPNGDLANHCLGGYEHVTDSVSS